VLLFCDTSALIKLLIDEPDSTQIHEATKRAELIAACRITWAEAMAAMARRTGMIQPVLMTSNRHVNG